MEQVLKLVYGFWDGDNIFIIRVVATKPGKWQWISGSNQPEDHGLNNHQGEFIAYLSRFQWHILKECMGEIWLPGGEW